MMNSHSTKPKTSFVTLAFLCVAVGILLLLTEKGTLSEIYHDLRNSSQEPLPTSVSLQDIQNRVETNAVDSATNQAPVNEAAEPDPEPIQLPAEFLLDVPFTTQAPFANWDLPYQEACEEASAITVHFFYEGKTFTKEIADSEIVALVEYENATLGFYKDTTAEETARVIRSYWDYTRVDVIDNPSIDDIKRHVYEGRPVIIPSAGKLLGNPNFRNGGPLYHMLVVRGWDADEFITNDVGTRNGENYRYAYATLMTAMHDWNGGDVSAGAKRMIVIYPKE